MIRPERWAANSPHFSSPCSLLPCSQSGALQLCLGIKFHGVWRVEHPALGLHFTEGTQTLSKGVLRTALIARWKVALKITLLTQNVKTSSSQPLLRARTPEQGHNAFSPVSKQKQSSSRRTVVSSEIRNSSAACCIHTFSLAVSRLPDFSLASSWQLSAPCLIAA